MKKSSNTSGTFGAPKPLPGQVGYKETETDRLKKDADEMEARLQLLQDRMQSQPSGATGTSGKGTWKSGSADKGSIRAYGKEVNDKVKKKLEASGGGDPALRSTLSSKRATKAQELDFKSKDVKEWGVSDVSAWLGELQLQQYVSAFAQNAISGDVLVDITAEDLDYMDIKALGHRKIILKSVEDLRRSNCYTPGTIASPQKMPDILRTMSNPNLGEGTSERSLMSKSMQVSGSKQSPSQTSQVKTTHWSNLEPISNNKVSNPRGGMINPADTEPGGLLDEIAERAAFAEAVAEWRRADAEAAAIGNKKPLVIEREYLKESSKSSAPKGAAFGEEQGGMSMWKNPFAPAPAREDDKTGYAMGEVLDEAAERKAFQEAVMEWRRGPTSTATNTSQPKSNSSAMSVTAATTTFTGGELRSNGFNDSFESDHGYQSPGRSNAGAKSAGTLLNGQLDEAREHEEFVKAVDSWREGKGGAAGTKTGSSSQALADKISLELEAAKEAMSLKLQKQKEEAERRMQEANLELKRLRSVKSMRDEEKELFEHKSSVFDSKRSDAYDDEEDEAEPSFTYSYSSAPSSHLGKGLRSAPELIVSPRVTSDSVAPTPRIAADEKDSTGTFGPQSTVEVSLVESVMGYHSSFRAEGKDSAEDYYVVEVDSDED